MTLYTVKTGDPIIVRTGSHRLLRHVDRTTPTKIIVDGVPYSKQTGRQFGPSTWAVNYVAVATTEESASVIEEGQRQLMIDSIADQCARHLLKEMSTEKLTNIYQTLH